MVFINGVRFDAEYFLNKECIYREKFSVDYDVNTVTVLWQDNKDITSMLMAVEAIRDIDRDAVIELVIPYVPYSAMDRRINDQLPTCNYIANIINKCEFERVYVLDPHSSVAKSSIKNLIEINLQEIVDKAISESKPDFIYYPDKGAYSKYMNTIDTHGIPVFHGYKHRDINNRGQLSPEMQIDTFDIPFERFIGAKVLIIDDICRKGGTAYYAALNIKKLGVSEVYLYVSHCEDCILQGNIFTTDAISRVYTTDSEYDITKVEDMQEKLLIIHNFREKI